MKRLGIVGPSAVALFLVGSCFGQSGKPCFAFLLKGDVHVACGGQTNQVTSRGDIDQFAISDEQSNLAFVTSRITKRTETVADAIYTTTLVDLRSGKTTQMAGQTVGDHTVVSTCGGIFRAFDPQHEHSGTVDLVTGTQIEMPPYRWFVCSSDRRVVAGNLGTRGGDLYEGIPPSLRVAALAGFHQYTYNISPDGSKIAYETDSRPLCVLSPGAPAQCADEVQGENFDMSVNNTGEALMPTHVPKECYYKGASNFSPEPFPGATDDSEDACLGIGYWKSGLKSIEIIEPLGTSPQWISPATAELLRKQSALQGRKAAK